MDNREKAIELLNQRFGDLHEFPQENLEEITTEQLEELSTRDSRDTFR